MNLHTGMNSAHVRIEHPGQGKVTAHAHSVNHKSNWNQVDNEN